MSIKVMAQVWEHDELGGLKKLILLALADWASDDGSRVYPSVAAIGRKCGFGERQARRYVSELRSDGYIELVKNGSNKGGRGVTAEYRIVLSRLETRSDSTGFDDGGKPGQIPPETRSDSTENPVTGVPLTVIEPLEEPPEEASPQIRTRKRTPRDEIWDGLVEACSLVVPYGERMQDILAVSQKQIIDAYEKEGLPLPSKEEVVRRGLNFRVVFDGASVSPTAIAKWWPQLNSVPVDQKRSSYAEDLYRRALALEGGGDDNDRDEAARRAIGGVPQDDPSAGN